jgi:hypothetical protein
MSEADFQIVMAEFERLSHECDTPQKATEQLKSEGLLDENGVTAVMYRESSEDAACQ